MATPTDPFSDDREALKWLNGSFDAHWGEATAIPGQAATAPEGADPDAQALSSCEAETLASHSPRAAARSWAVGSVLSGEPLLQTRPIVRDSGISFAQDLLRLSAPCTVAGYCSNLDAPQAPVPAVTPARFPHWAAIISADTLLQRWRDNPEERETLKQRLPDFLDRERPGRREEELLFLSALAAFHRHANILPHRATCEDLLLALQHFDRELIEISGEDHRLELWMTDGRALYALHRGPRAILLRGPKPDRSSQHTLHHKAKETPPAVLLTTTSQESGQTLPPGVFGVEASDPETVLNIAS